MSLQINIHDKVVEKIAQSFSAQFNVKSNIGEGSNKNFVGQLFPDLILIDKKTEKPVFIIEVKSNGNIAPCIQQWKSASSIPATLYLIVPESDLVTAKSVAQVVGLQTRFGFYNIDADNNITVKYE